MDTEPDVSILVHNKAFLLHAVLQRERLYCAGFLILWDLHWVFNISQKGNEDDCTACDINNSLRMKPQHTFRKYVEQLVHAFLRLCNLEKVVICFCVFFELDSHVAIHSLFIQGSTWELLICLYCEPNPISWETILWGGNFFYTMWIMGKHTIYRKN